MRRGLTAVILLVVLLSVTSSSVGNQQSFATGVTSKANTFMPLQDGRALYTTHCARCHGADGLGKTALGKTFKAPNLTNPAIHRRSDARFTRSIKNGRGNMPAFARKLSAQDIVALIAYVRLLKR